MSTSKGDIVVAKKKNGEFPTRAKLVEATFKAVVECNGSATNEEIQDHVIRLMSLTDAVVNIMHADNIQTRLQYELRWARTYLKKYGAITNSSRGVWSLTSGFETNASIDGNVVCQTIREMDAITRSSVPVTLPVESAVESILDLDSQDDEPWRTELSKILHEMNPYGFERLTMRLLRECGFFKVTVTKKSGDNGIDGFGKVKLNGIVTVNVAFQCKRYAGLISNSQIRDFRGSLSAGIEKGIFITTGAFSNAAVREAMDAGKTPSIDLIDGEDLISLIIEHELGVSKEVKTIYNVHKEFFDEI